MRGVFQASCNHRAYIMWREARSLKAASPFSTLYYRNRTPIVADDACSASGVWLLSLFRICVCCRRRVRGVSMLFAWGADVISVCAVAVACAWMRC